MLVTGLLLAACGADVALEEEALQTPSETPSPTESPSPTEMPSPTETPTASPTETPTPTSSVTAVPTPTLTRVDYHQPGDPQSVGSGLIEEFSLDGSALLVSEDLEGDETLACEGLPPVLLQRIDLVTGEKALATDDPEVYGALTRDGVGRAIITDQCEGYFVVQHLADENAEGELSVTGEVPYPTPGPVRFNYVDIRAGDDEATVIVSEEPGFNGGNALVALLAPTSGEMTPLLEGGYFEAVRVYDDGLLVSSFDGEVTLFDSDLEVVKSWEADWAYVSADRTAAILTDGADVSMVELATGLEAVITTLPEPIGDLAWSPDGTAVVAVTFGPEGSAFMLTTDGQVTEIAGSGDYARPAFSPTGDAVAFNEFGDIDADFLPEALVVRFG
jgi:hypothetical protein